ncbi:MAG: SDR family oxidoreductase [Rhodocyclaceae bacterium]|nr:SDR family oxidoreductase [Rhodocyclaceae bacterium]
MATRKNTPAATSGPAARPDPPVKTGRPARRTGGRGQAGAGPAAVPAGGRRPGRRALITGASAGIGAELARVFAARGHDLVLVARSADRLAALAAELAADHSVEVRILPKDLARRESPAELAAELASAGLEVDILVNNAGILEVGPFHAARTDRLLQLLDLNAGALTALTSLLLPGMVARGRGRILNVASIAAFQPVPSMAVYAATKAYVLALTEALSEELRGTGVTLTALCPGLTATDMMADIQAGSATAREIPALLVSSPADVARDGYTALMAGEVIRVPGLGNRIATGWSRVAPRWLVRTVAGLASRQADWMRR